jgi:hypothetical protein
MVQSSRHQGMVLKNWAKSHVIYEAQKTIGEVLTGSPWANPIEPSVSPLLSITIELTHLFSIK